jgi:hypothetical protein
MNGTASGRNVPLSGGVTRGVNVLKRRQVAGF